MRQEFLLDQATLYQLKIFSTVVKFGSFTRAGQELFLSQPAVCMQVKKLSKTLGFALFDKFGKNIIPSAAGKELIVTCDEIFNSMDKFEGKLADIQTLRQGTLRLSGLTAAKYVIPSTLGEFCRRYPEVDIAMKFANHNQLTERISKNFDDLYIVSEIPKSVDVISHKFFEDDLVVVASVNHPLAKQKNISLGSLSQEAFIMRELGSATRKQVQNLFLENNINVRVKMELNNNEMIQQLVANDLGVSVLSRHCIMPCENKLTILNVEQFPLRRQWYIVYPAKKRLSLVAETYLEYLLEISNNDSNLINNCKSRANNTSEGYISYFDS